MEKEHAETFVEIDLLNSSLQVEQSGSLIPNWDSHSLVLFVVDIIILFPPYNLQEHVRSTQELRLITLKPRHLTLAGGLWAAASGLQGAGKDKWR